MRPYSSCFRKLRAATLALAFGLVAVTASFASAAYTITDQLGRSVTLPDKVERIVCLQHHSLNILLELGVRDSIVGVMSGWEGLLGSYIANVFPAVRTLPAPGTLKDVNIEALAALRPDVLIVSNQMPEATVNQVQKLGIPVVVVTLYVADKEQASTVHPSLVNPDEAYTEGLKWAVETLGRIAGRPERAKQLWDTVVTNRRIVSAHLAAVPEEKRIRTYMANENMNTYGTGKYVGVAMEKAGAKNVAETIKGYKQVTVEQVVAWNPEVIFVQSRYASLLDEIASDPRWAGISAVKNKRLIMAPDYAKPWGNPTPESIALGELWLAKTLYPDAFREVNLDALVDEFYTTFYGITYAQSLAN